MAAVVLLVLTVADSFSDGDVRLPCTLGGSGEATQRIQSTLVVVTALSRN